MVNLKHLCPYHTFLKVNVCFSTAEIQNEKLVNTCFHLHFQHLRDLFKGTFGAGLANVMGNHIIIDAFKNDRPSVGSASNMVNEQQCLKNHFIELSAACIL